ncbi:hypothetical protein [Candidatus Phyllobacterium onerii]|uniref:hypothetical protein n=1 Tax=Candidatus Phyllobacterium onerii TaxID=3020828 RepID=UPI00232B4E5F|nr:hypothetical protein [Phyllobacterium sp. IY22]
MERIPAAPDAAMTIENRSTIRQLNQTEQYKQRAEEEDDAGNSNVGGRYMMKDAKGRTIINRTATSSDQSRLQSVAR